jgi:hypothetical protein
MFMATLEEILADVGLADNAQTKTASAAAPSSKEVNSVLESLGLTGLEGSAEDITKTASDERNKMGLLSIYEDAFGEEVVVETQTKVASTEEVTDDENEASTRFGELVGLYFSVAQDSLVEKLAGDLEMEAGDGYKPQGSAPAGGQLSEIVGKQGDPALPVNHDASSGAGLRVNTGNQTPYSLKAKAQIKAILSRRMSTEAGDVGGYHE